jgi:hypothetical protein
LPAFLLYGYAVENLLKGLFVKKHPGVTAGDRIQVPTHHDLPELAKEAGYAATTSETELMERLTTVITWSGRYPVAKTLHEHVKAGLNREAIFDDPVGAAADIVTMNQKLRKLIEDGKPLERNRGGVAIMLPPGKPADDKDKV